MFEAFGREDFDPEMLDAEVFPDEAEIFPAAAVPGLQIYRGRDGLREFLRAWTENFDDWSVGYEQLIDAPRNRVLALAFQTATGKGSGVPVDIRYGQVFEFEDGRVVRTTFYLDRAEARAAAGLSE
jgi:ketosteroid isomerase-like protein